MLAVNPNSLWFTAFLGMLAALPALSIDISSPSMALLPATLGTSKLMAGLTISLFMAGFALGQFTGGGLSDRHGRKPVLTAGFFVYSFAGVTCFLATTGIGLVASRFVQGFGAGICAVLSYAIVQDLFEGAAARAKRAYVTVILGGLPILAPAIGSAVIANSGWRAIYVLLACGGTILLVITRFFLVESRKTDARQPDMPVGRLEKTTDDPVFVLLSLVNALSYGAVFAYIAGSPILVIDYYRGSPTTYAEVFGCTAVALTLGAWTAARLGRRGVSADTLVWTGLVISAAASCGLSLSCLASRAISGPVSFMLLVVIIFCRGGISPNLQHLAIERQRERSGAASAVVGIMQLSFGTFSSVVVSALLAGFGPFAVAGPMMFFACAAASAWRWMKWQDHQRQITSPA